jgi:hypothetical protein
VNRTIAAVGTIRAGVMGDLYLTPGVLGEHCENVVLDVTLADGRQVFVAGRVTVWESTRKIAVDLCHERFGLTRETVSSMLQNAVRDRLIGSDVVRSAVARDFAIVGYA